MAAETTAAPAKARKARPFRPVVLTANELLSGLSVFLGPAGWVRDIAEAAVAASEEEAAALEARAVADEAANRVVGVYRVEITVEAGRPVPIARRERIRAGGLPTIPFGPAAAPRPRAAA